MTPEKKLQNLSVLLLLVLINCFFSSSVNAQKTENIKVSFPVWQYPVAKIPERFKTYMIAYKIGTRQLSEDLTLPILQYQKENADLKLTVIMGGLVFTKNYKSSGSGTSMKHWYYYSAECDHGFEIATSKDSLLGKSIKNGVYWSSAAYKSEFELKEAEAGVGRDEAQNRITNSLLEIVKKDLIFINYTFAGTLKEIEFEDPSIQSINKAVLETVPILEGLTKNTKPENNPIIEKTISELVKFVDKVNFEEKKGAFGKRTGNAALENLVILNLSIGEAEKANKYAQKFMEINKGLFADLITGTTTANYPFRIVRYIIDPKGGYLSRKLDHCFVSLDEVTEDLMKRKLEYDKK